MSLETHPCLTYHKDGNPNPPPLPGEGGFRTARSCDDRVWLFNISASGLDVHVRAPAFASGYLRNANFASSLDYSTAKPEDYLESESEATAAFGFSMTGTDIAIRESGIGVAGTSNKQINFFKPEWLY